MMVVIIIAVIGLWVSCLLPLFTLSDLTGNRKRLCGKIVRRDCAEVMYEMMDLMVHLTP